MAFMPAFPTESGGPVIEIESRCVENFKDLNSFFSVLLTDGASGKSR